MNPAQFFSNEAAYRAWMRGMPGIALCHEEAASGRKPEDPHDPGYPTISGPYYVSPEHLLLRVGSNAASSRFDALQARRKLMSAGMFQGPRPIRAARRSLRRMSATREQRQSP